MKFNKILLAALAAGALLATSCSKDNTGGNIEDAQPTYMGVTLEFPKAMGSRAEDPNAGTAIEKAVETVGVYIVDVNTGVLNSNVINISEFTPVSNVYTSKSTAAVETLTGTKQVFVILNPTAEVQAKIGNIKGAALNPIAFGVAMDKFLSASSMVMSGKATANVALTAVRTPAQAVEAANLVDVTVDRNLAKVLLRKGSAYEVVAGSTTLKFTTIAVANDAHFLPQTNTLYYTVPSAPATTDPYFNNFSAISGIADANYTAISEYSATVLPTAGFYVFENTPETFYTGNTTALRLKGVWVPDATEVDVYTAYDPATGAKTKGTISSGDSFYVSKVDGSYWSKPAYTDAIAAGANQIPASDFSAEYVNGVGYYTINVQDAAGVKGVARNHYYVMEVNKVLGPGSPTEIDNPNVPVEEDTYLAVKVTVKHWEVETSGHDIQ